jgi:hypothetical protein
MSDCESSPALFIPEWGDTPKGPRFILTVMALWADARGSIDCSEEELAAFTGYELKAVARHLKWGVDEGLVSRSERRRRADGTLTGYRYWLSGKLNGLRALWTNCRVDGVAASLVVPPPDNLSATRHSVPDATRHSVSEPPDNLSAPDEMSGGAVGEPARAGAAFPLPSYSYFHSFPWSDDVTKVRAGEVLAASGEGLGQLGEQNNRVLLSLAYVLEPGGVWSGFDHALDVLPVVKLKTGPGRASKLWDFALLTENIERYRLRRLRPERGPAAAPKRGPRGGSPPPAVVSPDEARVKRIATLQREIAIIERGERPLFLLPTREQRFTGEFLEDAFVALHARNVVELAGLLDGSGLPETAAAEGSA